MKIKPTPKNADHPPLISKKPDHGRIVAIADDSSCLDSFQLDRLETSFRKWATHSQRADVRLSRQRILIVFLLIRYTGAKLNEVLALNPSTDIDIKQKAVFFQNSGLETESKSREVQISEALSHEIEKTLANPFFQDSLNKAFYVDPGFVRRKFYERAQDCGFPKRLGGPEMIRKARAVELMRGNMPLPVVQMILGHSTPNLTSSYVSFSETEIRQVTRVFMDREASRKTSARNAFFGKIQEIRKGDIQARVSLTTISGYTINTIITIGSLERLGLKRGNMIVAEVKAPWVILQKSANEPLCSAENRFYGVISRLSKGDVNAEYVVRLSDGTELCAIVSSTSARDLNLGAGDPVWAFFNGFAVVLHIE